MVDATGLTFYLGNGTTTAPTDIEDLKKTPYEKNSLTAYSKEGSPMGARFYIIKEGLDKKAIHIGDTGAVVSMEAYYLYEAIEYDKNGNTKGDYMNAYFVPRMSDSSTSKEAHVDPKGEVWYVYKDDGELFDEGKHYLYKDSVEGYGFRVVSGGLMDGPEWIISLKLESPIPKISKSVHDVTTLSFNTIPSNLDWRKVDVMDLRAITTLINFTTRFGGFTPPALRGTDPATGLAYRTSILKYSIRCVSGKTPVPGSTGKFTIEQFDRTLFETDLEVAD